MQIDEDKIDDVILALLHLTSFDDSGNVRSWKSYDWSALDRLHAKGLISNPKTKSKSIVLSEEAVIKSKELFGKLFIKAA
jgi:hypothetical protein